MSESISPIEVLSEPSALEAMQRAEVDIQLSTAKRYPRELSKVKQSMMSFATLDQETAESCFYVLPRAGKKIEGPSVRLAEIAVSCYKNLRAGSRIIQTVTTGDNPHVVVQAVAHDLENNVAVTIEKRRRITKKRSKDFIDEDDINLAANAGSAIAFRDAVFKVVPLALIKPCFEAAKKVAIGDAKSLGDRRNIALDKLAKMGVDKDRVLASLQKTSVETIDLGDLEILFGAFTAIKDGQTTIDEAFPAIEKTASPKFSAGAATTPASTGVASGPDSQKAPPAATPSTTPAPEKKQPEEKKPSNVTDLFPGHGAQAKLQKFLEDQKVTFENFRKWAEETERLKNADSYGSWAELPTPWCEQLIGDVKSLNKCVVRCNS
jgi:hypothetical protein